MLSSSRCVPPSADGPHLQLTGVVTGDDVVRLAFAGEVDMSNTAWFSETVARQVGSRPHRWVQIDLAGVWLVDSSGIRTLLDHQRRAREEGRELTVVDAQPFVRRVLRITGVLDLLTGGARPDAPVPRG